MGDSTNMRRIVLRKAACIALSAVLACGLLPVSALADSAQDTDSGHTSSPAIGQAATTNLDDTATTEGEGSTSDSNASDSNAAETDGTATGPDKLLDPSKQR